MNAAKRPATPTSQLNQADPAQTLTAQPASRQQSRSQIRPQNSQKAPRRSVKRVPYAGARQAIAFESSVKLTVNLLLAVVATTTIAKLLPYYQSQQSRLVTLQESVEVAEKKNADLHQQFSRNFDPAQASRIMQEQSGLSYPNQKKVIWTTPPQLTTPNPSSDASTEK